MARKKFTAVDLFCGAGGLSEGFVEAGFEILAANDFDSRAAETFKLNHEGTRFYDGPIQNIGTDDMLNAAGLESGELDVLIGGPPLPGIQCLQSPAWHARRTVRIVP